MAGRLHSSHADARGDRSFVTDHSAHTDAHLYAHTDRHTDADEHCHSDLRAILPVPSINVSAVTATKKSFDEHGRLARQPDE
jgi:hypothetical protein